MKAGKEEDKEPHRTYSGRNLHLKVPAGYGQMPSSREKGDELWNIKEGILLSFSVFKSLVICKKKGKQIKRNHLLWQQHGLCSYSSKRNASPLPQTRLLLKLLPVLQPLSCSTSAAEPLPAADECAGSAVTRGLSRQGSAT